MSVALRRGRTRKESFHVDEADESNDIESREDTLVLTLRSDRVGEDGTTGAEVLSSDADGLTGGDGVERTGAMAVEVTSVVNPLTDRPCPPSISFAEESPKTPTSGLPASSRLTRSFSKMPRYGRMT